MITNPFPGLRAFETDEDHLYFGRDDQSDDILKRLRCNRFVAVVGASGSGKSSLIKAGLLPSLHGGFMVKAGSRWRIAVFRPGDRPIHNLAVALSGHGVLSNGSKIPGADALTVETTLRRSALGLIEAVRQARLPEQENLLIVVDQFEELFRFKAGLETEAFVKLLIEAARREDLPIYVVITMRSDFLGQCARFRELPEVINEGLYLIPLMTRAQYREAIDGPAAVAGAKVSPSLVNRLLNDIGDRPEELPIMQHALMRTWAYWLDSHGEGEPLDLSQYEEVGGMAEALSRHADEAYKELSEEHQQLAEKIFRALTEKRPGNPGIRRPTRVAALCAITEAEEADVIVVVENFRRPGRSFLMPPPEVPINSQTLIDISHESLISGWNRLREWVEGEALSAAIYRRVADTAELYYKDEAGLWRDPDLKVALGWQEKARPNKAWGEHYHSGFEAAISFLKESKQAVEHRLVERDKQRKRALRRTQVTASALFVLALASTTLGFMAWKQGRYAEGQAVKATQAKVLAEQAKDQADRAKQDALRAETVALQASAEALKEKELAEAQRAQAEKNLTLANAAMQRALDAERRALDQRQRAEQLAIRMRGGNAQRSKELLAYTDLLAQDSPSLQQNVYFRLIRAFARAQAGNHKKAIDEATLALDAAPRNPYALGLRAYEYLLLGRAREGVQDLEKYLKDNPTDSNQQLNLSLGLGMLGEQSASIEAANRAVNTFTYNGEELFDSEVSAEIQEVTNQPILYADGDAFKTALNYQTAARSAISGSKENFVKMLKEADEQARKSPRPVDAYLVALNWIWLQQRDRPQEYGALVIQGALWERASAAKVGLAARARRDYERFLKEHRVRGDSRYDDLAKWVVNEMRSLNKRHFPNQTRSPLALELAIRAEEAIARDETAAGFDLLARAVVTEPENVDLRIRKVTTKLYSGSLSPEEVSALVDECQEILKRDPKAPTAQFVIAWAKPENDQVAQLRRLLSYQPHNPSYLSALSEKLAEAGDNKEALEFLTRVIALHGRKADLLHRKAKLLAEKGDPRDLVEAEQSIDQAISLKADDPQFYDAQAKIKEQINQFASATPKKTNASPGGGAGKPMESGNVVDAELIRQRAAGYNTAADAMLKRGDTQHARETYAQSLGFLDRISGDQRSADVHWDMSVTIHKIAKLLEQQESKAKAIEVMKKMKSEFGNSEDVQALLDTEIARLSNSP